MDNAIDNIEGFKEHVDRKRYQYIGMIGLFLVSLILYFARPNVVSMPFNYVCFGLFLISTWLYYHNKNKKNYLDFDTIFIILYAIIGFAYSVFLYDESEPYSIAFRLSFNVNYIPTGSILFVIGIQAYYLGAMLVNEGVLKNYVIDKSKLKPINNTLLSIIVIFLCVAFILAGGVQYYRAIYYYKITQPESGLILQILALLHAFAVTAIGTEFYNKVVDENYKLNILLISIIVCIIGFMLYAGNRTLASQLALPVIGLFTMFFMNVGKLKLLIFMIFAFVFMWYIQFHRAGIDVDSAPEVAGLINDLTIPTRSTYSCIEYIHDFGYMYGMNLSGGIIGIVPSLERLLVQLFGLNPRMLGSAEILTDYTWGGRSGAGLGTNIIADLNLSFGLVGIIFFMFVIGYFVNKQFLKVKMLNYYSFIIYSCMLSFSVYWVRTTYTHPTKLIVWSIIISVLNKSLSQKLFEKSESKK